MKWLSDDDFNYHKNTQSHLVRNRQPGTRKWLLESHEWESWLTSGGRTLYCPGIPGSGKTFTTAMVAEKMAHLSEKDDLIFAYVFCSYQQREDNKREILLRSLLRMVLEQTAEISGDIQQWYDRCQEPSIDMIMAQLRLALDGHSRAVLLVDALDELDSSHRVGLVSDLVNLQRAIGVNLYFTSRDIPNIRLSFEGAIIVPVKATEHDVGMYLTSQMGKPHVPNFIRTSQSMQDEIIETVVNAVGDM